MALQCTENTEQLCQ